MKIKVGTRIITGYILLISLMVIGGITSFFIFKDIEKKEHHILDIKYKSVRASEKVMEGNLKSGMYIREYLLTGNEKSINQYNQAHSEVDESLNALSKLAEQDEIKIIINNTKETYDKFDKKITETIGFKKQGNMEMAIHHIQQEAMPLMNKIMENTNLIIKHNEEQMEQLSNGIYDDIFNAKSTIIAAIVLSLISSLAIAFFITRSITRPINKLMKAAESVANGDLSTVINIKGNDEISSLAQAIDKMISNIKELIQKISLSSQQLLATSQELSATSQQTSTLAQNIADLTNDIANNTNEQSKSLLSTGNSMSDLSMKIDEVNRNNQVINQSFSKTKDASILGYKVAIETGTKMERINKETVNIINIVSQLEKGSEEIGNIVGIMKGIAEQTKLLSLNAAIEAAAAGKKGRGFAIVAEEVRRLAEQSRTSAEEISNIIINIQKISADVATSINSGSQDIFEGAKAVESAMNTFKQITKEINLMSEQISLTLTLSCEIVGESKKVDNAIINAKDIATLTNNNAQAVAESIKDQATSFGIIAGESTELAGLAEELQSQINKFKHK